MDQAIIISERSRWPIGYLRAFGVAVLAMLMYSIFRIVDLYNLREEALLVSTEARHCGGPRITC